MNAPSTFISLVAVGSGVLNVSASFGDGTGAVVMESNDFLDFVDIN